MNVILHDEIREELVRVIAVNLPAKLTEEQARWWIKHQDYIPGALENLARVSVNPGRSVSSHQ